MLNKEDSGDNMADQIEESEREMKEMMAREILMQDDNIGANSSVDNTVRAGI